MFDLVRANPLKSAAATVSALGVLIGAMLAIDARWNQASAVEAHEHSIKELVADASQMRQDSRLRYELGELRTQLAVLEINRNALQNKLIELDVRQGRTPADRELAARYRADVQNIENAIRAKRREIEVRAAGLR